MVEISEGFGGALSLQIAAIRYEWVFQIEAIYYWVIRDTRRLTRQPGTFGSFCESDGFFRFWSRLSLPNVTPLK